jgi:hypothetical protein
MLTRFTLGEPDSAQRPSETLFDGRTSQFASSRVPSGTSEAVFAGEIGRGSLVQTPSALKPLLNVNLMRIGQELRAGRRGKWTKAPRRAPPALDSASSHSVWIRRVGGSVKDGGS